MIETRRSYFYPNNFKFCTVRKKHKYLQWYCTEILSRYVIVGKTENRNVYVRPSHVSPSNVYLSCWTTNIPSDKDAGDIAKSIVDLDMSAKAPACHVSIPNIITRKDEHQHNAVAVNNHLKEMCTNKNINLIYHSKNIKHKHLNKSKFHLTNRGTNILSTFMREM